MNDPISIQIERDDIFWLKQMKERAQSESREARFKCTRDECFTDTSRTAIHHIEVLERILKQV